MKSLHNVHVHSLKVFYFPLIIEATLDIVIVNIQRNLSCLLKKPVLVSCELIQISFFCDPLHDRLPSSSSSPPSLLCSDRHLSEAFAYRDKEFETAHLFSQQCSSAENRCGKVKAVHIMMMDLCDYGPYSSSINSGLA